MNILGMWTSSTKHISCQGNSKVDIYRLIKNFTDLFVIHKQLKNKMAAMEMKPEEKPPFLRSVLCHEFVKCRSDPGGRGGE